MRPPVAPEPMTTSMTFPVAPVHVAHGGQGQGAEPWSRTVTCTKAEAVSAKGVRDGDRQVGDEGAGHPAGR